MTAQSRPRTSIGAAQNMMLPQKAERASLLLRANKHPSDLQPWYRLAQRLASAVILFRTRSALTEKQVRMGLFFHAGQVSETRGLSYPRLRQIPHAEEIDGKRTGHE
jgi:hypothetical protein